MSPINYKRSRHWGTTEAVDLRTNTKAQVRKGDIIKLPDSKGIPKFARGCLGVITRRYRTERRLEQVYYNYGAEIMLLDGPKKGKTIPYFGK